ncbi:hypothetical protein GQ457_01G011070 [Hibiscus cannabinus]
MFVLCLQHGDSKHGVDYFMLIGCCNNSFKLLVWIICLVDANITFNRSSCRNTMTYATKFVNCCKEDQFRQMFDDSTVLRKQGIKKNNLSSFSVLKAYVRMYDERMSGK